MQSSLHGMSVNPDAAIFLRGAAWHAPKEPIKKVAALSRRRSREAGRNLKLSASVPLEQLQAQHPFPSSITNDFQKLLWSLTAHDQKVALLFITEETANASDESGFYALHYAVLRDNAEAVEKLLECGAVTCVRDRDKKKTPYLLAFQLERKKSFEILDQYASEEEKELVQEMQRLKFAKHKE
jgi:hypothetical protein